ncbi:phospholipase D delta isoform X1 [Punica granatum]|uniref:Phospholipase D n=1 Tax=Punica granatum TaxID=22663 RepID=A0A6P8E5U6_PUNGR|nr:phospholipase D delta isoform X1 [Punica granatum]
MADLQPDQTVYLHGDLDLLIIEACNLPNMDVFSSRLRSCVTACGACAPTAAQPSAAAGDAGELDSGHRPKIITSDPYVTVVVPQATVARTRVLKNSRNPKWNQRFHIPLAHPVVDLEFQVKDDDVFGSEVIGTAKISAAEIAKDQTIEGWYRLTGSYCKPNTKISLKMTFTSVDKNPIYQRGIAGQPEKRGVTDTYFPLRKGGHVTLYQDAHVPDGLLPEIELDGGKVFRHEKCWEDICYAISEAHHLIYIVGWSVFHKIRLVREPTRPLPRGGNLNLGELLKYKSEEGVRVLLLVWDDKTSHNKYFINTEGVMQTHDEETRKFFKHSSVNCVLAPRYASSKIGILKQQVVGTMFTHHQKCVLVDTQATGNNRKITAFIGGIDLCDGRYDTPEHRLFRDLDTIFKDDFHNPTFPPGSKAPRQPWHDLHCRIDGNAAYDVLINFEQRWRKATRWKEFSLFFKGKTQWHDDSLIKIERISWFLSPFPPESPGRGTVSSFSKEKEERITKVPKDNPLLYVSREEDPENWHVQVFRSIDSGSVKGFPTKNKSLAESQHLIVAKNILIDGSIQTAYIQAIRSAQHFIYIENQYFLGSSYGWPSYKNAGADNLIPMEIALKIASKIRANERFAAYIIIPMWPEGDPKTATVQEILYWQSQTMQMMYGVVAEELKRSEHQDLHPQDFLNFYCLGKREEIPNDSSNDANGAAVTEAYKSRRFMIYVHAKGMIVDDEYVILGSANINQRSLAGTKDTEIAMGAYQPHHSWAKKRRHPRGQVYGYRMSLWAEHLGHIEDCFEEPKSLECVRKVNEMADSNWRDFAAENFTPLQGHLLKYPMKVEQDGTVGPLRENECFPDTGGKVLGTHSTALPDVLTT